MQKVVTIRASQKDLEAVLEKFISSGWRILNVTRGSMWGRVGLSYKWTIILELGENYNNAEQKIKNIIREFSSKSYAKTALLCIATLACIFALFAILYAVLL